MSPLALGLLLASAFVHAGWNLAAKRAGGGAAFVWLFSALGVAVLAPFALAAMLVARPPLGWVEAGLIAGTSVLHAAYFLALQRGYRHGDLSVVYPLARGAGPLLSVLGAVVLLGERPGPLALAGALLIAAAVVLLAGGADAARRAGAAAVGFGLLTGLTIAAYTLWDRQAVAVAAIPPAFYLWGEAVGMTLLLAPFAAQQTAEIARLWRHRRPEVLAVALGSPLAYGLVLTALVSTPVTAVAPIRELSILVAAILGARLLGEGDARRRLLAAAGMVAGVAAIAIS